MPIEGTMPTPRGLVAALRQWRLSYLVARSSPNRTGDGPLLTEGTRYVCGRCLVTYRVEKPTNKPNQSLATYARCPECGMQFWSGDNGKDTIRMGIDPTAKPVFAERRIYVP